MTRQLRRTWEPPLRARGPLLASSILLVVLLGYGCKESAHTSDPKLRKIDQMLEAQLPNGTPRSRVEFFLSVRGYNMEDSSRKDLIVALIRQVDTDTLQPVTARVTFHFDAHDKLTSYELQPAPNAPLPP